MRRFDLLTEYSTVISPASARAPCKPTGSAPYRVRLPLRGAGHRNRHAALAICIAAIVIL